MSWQSVAFDGFVPNVLGSVLGGVIAGVVAFKTVKWTQAGDRRQAAADEQRRAAEAMVRATLLASGAVLDQLNRGPAADDSLAAWRTELEVQSPLLLDVLDLLQRLQRYQALLTQAELWESSVREAESTPFVSFEEPGEPSGPPRFDLWREAAGDEIRVATDAILQALQDTRRAVPLSPGPPACLPRITPDADWPEEDVALRRQPSLSSEMSSGSVVATKPKREPS